ncbi:MAG: hypothetical protein L6Q95_14965, partial [Planctomycetes bacterium]|nr:hypothetical protein [Planctomycetota bacterium]
DGGAAGEDGAVDAGADGTRAGRDRPPEPPPVDGRLVYPDGSPAGGVLLHLAIGRAVEVRVFRNGEYTDQTVHLVTAHQVTTTDAEGSFRFAGAAGPARERRFVYTANDPQAFAVEELRQVVSARRRATVTGRLVDREGKPLPDYWFEGRFGDPEDWQTRIRREEDLFVAATGDLRVDTLARNDTRTRADGTFSLRLAEGRNTLVFGEVRAEGSVDVEVRAPATELGEIRVPGAKLADEGRTLAGRVLTLAGLPHAGCEVLAWDGSVGLPTHATETDEAGAFAFEGLRSHEVILWAVPTERRHIDLPIQTTATLRMPSPAPITLQAPSEEEYAWARVEIPGFYLFVRPGVFASGDALDRTDVVGLPPGPLRIHLVTDRILEATVDLREPGDIVLHDSLFRDTTRD